MKSDKVISLLAFLLIVNISMVSFLIYQNFEFSKKMAEEMQITSDRISDINDYLGDFSEDKNRFGIGALYNKSRVTFSDVMTEMMIKLKSVEQDISSIQIQEAIDRR